jgi:hypothetical protein
MVLILWLSRHFSHLLVWHRTVERIMCECVWVSISDSEHTKTFLRSDGVFLVNIKNFLLPMQENALWVSESHCIVLLRYLPSFLPSDLSPDHQSRQPTPLSFEMLVWFLCTSCDAWAWEGFFAARCYLNSTGLWQRPCSLYVDTRT